MRQRLKPRDDEAEKADGAEENEGAGNAEKTDEEAEKTDGAEESEVDESLGDAKVDEPSTDGAAEAVKADVAAEAEKAIATAEPEKADGAAEAEKTDIPAEAEKAEDAEVDEPSTYGAAEAEKAVADLEVDDDGPPAKRAKTEPAEAVPVSPQLAPDNTVLLPLDNFMSNPSKETFRLLMDAMLAADSGHTWYANGRKSGAHWLWRTLMGYSGRGPVFICMLNKFQVKPGRQKRQESLTEEELEEACRDLDSCVNIYKIMKELKDERH